MHLSRLAYRSSLQAPSCRSLLSMIPLNESEYGLALSSEGPTLKASDGTPPPSEAVFVRKNQFYRRTMFLTEPDEPTPHLRTEPTAW